MEPGHGNLVLITSTVQVEISKLNFDDITTYFLQALSDCREIKFVTFNGLCPLIKPPVPISRWIEY